jgi:hypothetical protein
MNANPSLSEKCAYPDPHRQSRIDNLEDQITELAAHIHAATYQLLLLIREYDQTRGWSGPGLKSCAHWLNWKCGIALSAAREKVRVAHALEHLPQISEGLRNGRVSYSKVRAMTRVATPDNEDYLMQIANHGTAAHVERLVRNFRKVKRLEALEHDNHLHNVRAMRWYSDADGSWVFRGRLTAEQGAVVQAALEAAMNELFQEQRDVSAETSEDGVSACSEPAAQRRADALVRLAEGPKPAGGERCTVNLHTDLDTLQAYGAGAQSELAGHGNVSAETSRRLACDCAVVRWQEDQAGKPLSIGRKSRSIPPAIRRALQRRDGGCRFPGCTCSRFVDAHHVVHWADGGDTSLDNLVLLCRHHHRLVHEGGFGVVMNDDERPEFTDRLGRSLPLAPETRFRGNVIALEAWQARNGVRITPTTPVPAWHGEEMDDELAVLGLIQKE